MEFVPKNHPKLSKKFTGAIMQSLKECTNEAYKLVVIV